MLSSISSLEDPWRALQEGALYHPMLLACWWTHTASLALLGLLVYFGYGIRHSKENLRELQQQTVSARYVVFPSGSLEETVQTIQPSTQPSQGLEEPMEEEAKR